MNGATAINILRKSLNRMDRRLVNHGDRVAYILYHMIKCDDSYAKDDLDRFLILGLLHDVGAYATEEIDSMLSFDTQRVWPHSVYGYLYLRYLSPLQRYADIILYHHLDYSKFHMIDYFLKNISMYLNIADRLDIHLLQNQGIFNKIILEQFRGTRFSPHGLDLLYQAENTYGLVDKINNGSYVQELDRIIGDIDISNADCREYLKLLVFSIDFKQENTVYRTITTHIVANRIAHKFEVARKDEDRLYYASLLYDVGMLSVPEDITNSPRTLNPQERSLVNRHVAVTEETLKGLVSDEVLEIAIRHHERLNGEGYPRGLKEDDFTLPQMILQVADVIGALSCKNMRRDAFDVDDILAILTEEAEKGSLSEDVIDTFTYYLNEIVEDTLAIRKKTLQNYWAIKEQFQDIIKRFDQFNR